MDEPEMKNLTDNALAEGPAGAVAGPRLPGSYSSPVVIALWLAPLVLIGSVLVGTFWFVGSFHQESWSTLFEGRSFDTVSRRRILQELQQSGVKFKAETDGRIQVRPDELAGLEANLEKKGLKPETLEEIRASGGGALAILESPLQRDERARNQKEKELTWLIRRAGEFRDVQVSVEPLSATRRFINDSGNAGMRVRVFLEPLRTGTLVDEKSVEKIRNIILASVSGSTDEQITVHDAENVYVLGLRKASDVNESAARPEMNPAEIKSLENRIRTTVEGLADAKISVSLNRVEELQSATVNVNDKKNTPEKPVIYFNEPVAIEIKSNSIVEKKQTTRAHVSITLPGNSTLTPELKRICHADISRLLNPILLEKLDWAKPEPITIAAAPTEQSKPKSQAAIAIGLKNPAESEIKTLVKSSQSLREPWILGAMGAGLFCALAIARKLFTGQRPVAVYQSDTIQADDQSTTRWREDSPGRTPPAANSFTESEAMPVDQAAEVLSDWISGNGFANESDESDR